MRLDRPRVLPTTADDWDDETKALAERQARHNNGRVLNVMATMARHPELLKRWMPFGNHVLGHSTLPKRARELIILRTGLNARSGYEWAQHVSIARAVGCTDDEILRVIDGPDAPGWTDADRALLRATDELMADDFVTDATWTALIEHWNEQQRIDLVFAVGQYRMTAMALNTFGVQIEDGVERFPSSLYEGGHFLGPPK
jgi:alkylhydroperoxidase family enzyme